MPLPHAKICNAHKRDGSQCGMAAIRGKTKCRMHGGKNPSGIAHPNYKGLGYSKSLPARLAVRYEEAVNDPRLFSMRKDAAACRARLHELFERLDSGESGEVWQHLGAAHAAFTLAVNSGDAVAMRKELAVMQEWIGKGQGDYAAWEDVRATWESLCRLTTTEQKTLVTMSQVMTYEQVALYMGVIAESIREIVVTHVDGKARQQMLMALETKLVALADLDTGVKVG